MRIFYIFVLIFCLFFLGCQKRTRLSDYPSDSTSPDFFSSPLPITFPSHIKGVVILDAGHGGKDPGATHHQVMEKDVALSVVLKTASILRSRGVTVYLTRSDDRFISLPSRSYLANHHPGSLFISVHANSVSKNPDLVRGIETYILSNTFNDFDRATTASNKFKVSGSDLFSSQRLIRDLTISSRLQSRELATFVQKHLVIGLGDLDRGVKSANFSVLRETYLCPAILVELGFISHSSTAQKMSTDSWRLVAAESLASGIFSYLLSISR